MLKIYKKLGPILILFIFLISTPALAGLSRKNTAVVNAMYNALRSHYGATVMASIRQKGWSAHRGYEDLAPENTLPAYELAGKCGAVAIEGDVQASTDGVLFMSHDGSLERMTGKTIRFSSANSSQIKKVAIRSGNNIHLFSDLKTCTFSEYLSVCKKYGCIAFIDLKNIDKKVSEKAIKRLKKEIYSKNMQNHCVILTFYPEMAEIYRKYDKRVPICPMINKRNSNWARDLKRFAKIKNTTMNGYKMISFYGSGNPYKSGINPLNVRISSSGNKKTATLRTAIPIQDASIWKIDDVTYNGKAYKPLPRITYNGKLLTKGKDYTLTYYDNTKAGMGKIRVVGKGNYNGFIRLLFKIDKFPISKATISVPSKVEATGKQIKPKVTVKVGKKKLKNGTDYKLAWKNNKNQGWATVTISGIGNYRGTVKKKFKITGASISTAKISKISKQTYTGKEIRPAFTIKKSGKQLKRGRDYSVTFEKNFNAGTAVIIIRGKGAYSGTLIKMFSISRAPMKSVTVLKVPTQKYTGKPIRPSLVLKRNGATLRRGIDYSATYLNNTKRGTATVKITGKGNYAGSITTKFTIK